MFANVMRPNTSETENYRIHLDGPMLHLFEEMAAKRYRDIDDRIGNHAECNISLGRCKVQAQELEAEHGSLEKAASLGLMVTDCSEALMFLHEEARQVMEFIFQSRYVRNNKDSKGYKADQELQTQARRVVDTAERTLLDTGLLNLMDEETIKPTDPPATIQKKVAAQLGTGSKK